MNAVIHPGLSARLKAETRSLHVQSERSGVMVGLLRGKIERAGYCALLRNLHALYAALEPALERLCAARPTLMWQPALSRLAGLQSDLQVLAGADWRETISVLPAMQRYVAHLQALDAKASPLLLAHAYLRYLGDLHGGQMIARIVRQAFDLSGSEGCAFYDFGSEAQVERLRVDFRAGLDALALAPALEDAFVAEACEAFRMHQQLFDELMSV